MAALHQNFPVGYRRDDSRISGLFKLSELQQYAVSTRSHEWLQDVHGFQ